MRNRLHAAHSDDPAGKVKSVVFTDQGPERAKALSKDMFKKWDIASGSVAPDLLAAVIASAAKQSILLHKGRMDCFGRLAPNRFRTGYFSVIASPLRSAFAIRPVCWPESSSTAPFWLVRMIARAPRPIASPAPAAP